MMPHDAAPPDPDQPIALVITAAGINCDLELAHAFELAGARAESMHLNDLSRDPDALDRFDLIGLPGGFSFGDAVAAGRIAASIMRQTLWNALVKAVRRGVLIIAPCNGFQIAVQLGLLPGPVAGQDWPEQPSRPSVALTNNESARFIDRWCGIEIPSNTRCLWTRGLVASHDAAILPIAHGEGRFIVAERAMLDSLDRAGQIALRYRDDDNPNGSMGDVAGICDASGHVFGLMPHPERFTSWNQHPWWTRLDRSATSAEEPLGLRMFRNAVEFARRDRSPLTRSRGQADFSSSVSPSAAAAH